MVVKLTVYLKIYQQCSQGKAESDLLLEAAEHSREPRHRLPSGHEGRCRFVFETIHEQIEQRQRGQQDIAWSAIFVARQDCLCSDGAQGDAVFKRSDEWDG